MKLGLDEDYPVQKLLDNLIPVRVVAVCNRLQLNGGLLVDLRLCRFIRALVLRRDDRDESLAKCGIYGAHRGLECVELILLGLAVFVDLLLRLRASILQALNTVCCSDEYTIGLLEI